MAAAEPSERRPQLGRHHRPITPAEAPRLPPSPPSRSGSGQDTGNPLRQNPGFGSYVTTGDNGRGLRSAMIWRGMGTTLFTGERREFLELGGAHYFGVGEISENELEE